MRIDQHLFLDDSSANKRSQLVYSNVSTEPKLQPISLEKRSEVLLLNLSQAQDWTSLQMGSGEDVSKKHILDVRVFNHFAPSNSHSNLTACYRKHELIKKRAYMSKG